MNNADKVAETFKKLRAENKAARNREREAQKNLENVASQLTGTALFSQWHSALQRQGDALERAFLACDMAMIVATAQSIAAVHPTFTAEEKRQVEEAKSRSRDLFRDAARLQKRLVPFSEIHFEFDFMLDSFDAEKCQKYLKDMEALWPILEQADALYETVVDWRHKWTEATNTAKAAEEKG